MNQKKKLLLGLIFSLIAYGLWKENFKFKGKTSYIDDLLEMVDKRAQNKVIILCIIDASFVDMVINFYQSSLLPHKITNYLFCASSSEACHVLSQHSIACAQYTDTTISNKASSFFSLEFREKMNQRASVLFEVLKAGYTVIHTDSDLYFFENPLPFLEKVASRNDIGAMWDVNNYNAGFLVIRPSKLSLLTYEKLMKHGKENQQNDQVYLNAVIKEIQLQSPKQLLLERLSTEMFPCGHYYFDKDKRYFPKPCPQCIVVHNNYIISKEAKIYRFKEHNMWFNDEGQYYSSPHSKYMTFTILDLKHQMESLKTALAIGRILGRKVILPRFSNPPNKYPLYYFLCMTSFDEAFKDEYRENSFLTHPLVPKDLKQTHNVKQIFLFSGSYKSMLISETIAKNSSSKILLYRTNPSSLDEQEILDHFAYITNRIINFNNLTSLNVTFSKTSENSKFQLDTVKGFKKCDSLQRPL